MPQPAPLPDAIGFGQAEQGGEAFLQALMKQADQVEAHLTGLRLQAFLHRALREWPEGDVRLRLRSEHQLEGQVHRRFLYGDIWDSTGEKKLKRDDDEADFFGFLRFHACDRSEVFMDRLADLFTHGSRAFSRDEVAALIPTLTGPECWAAQHALDLDASLEPSGARPRPRM